MVPKFNSKHERSTSPNIVTVKSVRRVTLDKPVAVCDLTVAKHHNFALASGVYVHNCEKARSPHHEIIKLRGVGVNAQKAESSKTLGNREIKLIIKALGIKPGETDLSKMRTHDITILTDADQDGKHIASLLLAFFKVYYPELVRQGRIRYINGPLYMGQLRDTRKFGDTKEEVLAQFEAKSRNGVRLTRLKGWGECFEILSHVQTAHGQLRLGDIVAGQPEGWSVLANPVQVVDGNGDLRTVTRVFRKKSACVRVRAGGRSLTCTEDHMFMVVADGAMTWVRAGDLQKGDVVLTSRSGTFGASVAFDVSSIYVNLPAGSSTRAGRVPTSMTPELARLLGYLVADGSNTTAIYSGEYPDVVDDIVHCFETCFPDEKARIRQLRDGASKGEVVCLSDATYVSRFFSLVGYNKGVRAHTKDVPWSVSRAPRECVAAFIQGVFESDGYFGDWANGYIEHYTASEQLAISMSVLLGMFGIHAAYSEEKNVMNPFTKERSGSNGYTLKLYGNDVDIYVREIGLRSPTKTAKLQHLVTGSIQRNTNTDVLFGVKDAIKKLRATLTVDQVRRCRIGFSTGARDISYAELRKNADVVDRIRDVAPEIAETLEYALKHNPRFIHVESVDPVEGEHEVADLEVPESHSYIANGIVVHNCQPDQLAEVAFEPKTRRITTLTMDVDDEVRIGHIMGKDVEHRKDLLSNGVDDDAEEVA